MLTYLLVGAKLVESLPRLIPEKTGELIFLFAWPGYELNTLALLLKWMNAASVRNARVLSVLLTNEKEYKWIYLRNLHWLSQQSPWWLQRLAVRQKAAAVLKVVRLIQRRAVAALKKAVVLLRRAAAALRNKRIFCTLGLQMLHCAMPVCWYLQAITHPTWTLFAQFVPLFASRTHN